MDIAFTSDLAALGTPLAHDLAALGTTLAHDLLMVGSVLAQQDLKGIIDKITTQIKGVMVAIGLLGILLWAMAHLASPLLPDWAQGMKGYFQKAMIALVVAGFGGTLVTWLYGLGSS